MLTLILCQLFPLLVLIVLGLFYIPNYFSYYREVIAFGLQTVIVSALSISVKQLKIRKYLLVIGYLLLALLLIIKLSFYHLYDTKINVSALYVVFETNMFETIDFLKTFINGYIIILFLIVFSSLFLFIKLVLISNKLDASIQKLPTFYFKHRLAKIIVVVLCYYSLKTIYVQYPYENILLETYNSYNDYNAFKANMKNTLAQETTDNINVFKDTEKEETYVVVIGESTSRWHMQLYGYNRNTNPLLTSFKNELYVFNDVISPHTHTLLSLEKTLTLSNYKKPNKKSNASIVQLANQAGFTTFWLSNQKRFGFYESIPSLIGNAANYKKFINSDDFIYDAHDEKLLPHLDEVLNRKEKKKMIFIHLMGTHNNYDRRYPKEYDYFTGVNPITKFQHSKSTNQINMYDNAIRYNDFIVKTIIDKVKEKNTNSFVVYFSDHGDELYDTVNLLGHNEFHGTKPMYDVPFILWLSEKYKLGRPDFLDDKSIVNRKYNLEDFFHSFSDLSQIKFKESDSTKSIFDNSFVEKKRLIKDGVDYDKM